MTQFSPSSQNLLSNRTPEMLPFSVTQFTMPAILTMPIPLPPPLPQALAQTLPKLKQGFNKLLQSHPRLNKGFLRLNDWDNRWIIWFNQLSHDPKVAGFFKAISRLGDGWIWGIATVFASGYLYATSHHFTHTFFAIYSCLFTSAVGYSVYKFLKNHTVRPRPYRVHPMIRLGERPLDVFSFPSGHTLQAVIFSIMLCHFVPVLGWVLIPFTGLVAVSRLILGLHYPTDVVMGAVLGVMFAKLGLGFGGKWFGV